MYSDEVKELINKNNTKNLRIRLVRGPLYQKVVYETDFLPEEANLRQRSWHVLNNNKEIPKCPKCGDSVRWDQPKNKYRTHCSCRCSTISEEVKEKVKQTCLKIYGIGHQSQKYFSKNTIEKIKNRYWLINQHHSQEKTLKEIAENLKIGASTLGLVFKKLGIEVKLYPNISQTSKAEQEIVTYIELLYPEKEIQNPNRSIIFPKQLDIYLPDMNLAIEYNGVRFHSTERVGNSNIDPKEELYHFNKYNLCKKKNVKLIHIFENEWELDKIDIMHWIEKYINQDTDFITKGLLIRDLKDQKELDLSLNWPINVDKLEELGYKLVERLDPVEQLLGLKIHHTQKFKIHDCGRVIYKRILKEIRCPVLTK